MPQKIRSDAGQTVDLMFRPTEVFRNSSVVAECGGRELVRRKAMIYTPGEMAVISLKPEMIASATGDTIVVRMERN